MKGSFIEKYGEEKAKQMLKHASDVRKGKPLRKLPEKEILELFINKKLNTVELANKYSVHVETIVCVLKRVLGKVNLASFSYHNISKEDLYDYYIVKNKTILESSEFFKCGKSTISRHLKKYNIKK